MANYLLHFNGSWPVVYMYGHGIVRGILKFTPLSQRHVTVTFLTNGVVGEVTFHDGTRFSALMVCPVLC
jgi:hypothetical protein